MVKIELANGDGIEELGGHLAEQSKKIPAESKELIIFSNFKPELTTRKVLEKCKAISRDQEEPVYCLVNNTQGIFVPAGGVLETPFDVVLCELTGDNVKFFGETSKTMSVTSKYKTASFLDVSGNFCIEGQSNNFCKVFFEMENNDQVEKLKADLSSGKEFLVSGMLVNVPGQRKVVRGMGQVTDRAIFATSYSLVEEDLSFLNDALPLIKGSNDLALLWDFEADKNPWTEIETFIFLLSLFYMELGQSCYNLIVFGARSSKKSAVLMPLSWIFGTPVISATGVRGKALVPHWGDSESNGLLMEAKFVAPVDELFRKFSQEEGFIQSYRSIRKGLEQMMNLVDREDHIEGTGRGTKQVRLRNSFIATDNLADDTITAIIQINKIDAPIMKRYTVMRLSRESEVNGERMFNLTSEEVKPLLLEKLKKVNLDFKKYAVLGRLIRREMQRVVKFDVVRLRQSAENIVAEARVRYDGINIEYDFHKKIRAIMKSITVLNSIFRNDHLVKAYEAVEEDYMRFESIFRRLTDDHFRLFGERDNKEEQRRLPSEVKKDERTV